MSKIEDILAEFADGFLDGSIEIADLIEKYNILPGSELETLLQLAASLEGTLLPVEPTPEFILRLREQLLNEETETLLQWLRSLSPRQQIAAGIGGLTVAAGIFWIARRSSLDLRLRRPELETLSQEPDSSSALAS